jgi:hypothetical protein
MLILFYTLDIFGHAWEKREMHIGYWWGSQKEGDH